MDVLNVVLKNTEENFVYNYGSNKGFTKVSHKVSRCFFLSSEAKQLYVNIRSYAYGDKRSCFPSQASLMAELNWSQPTLTKFLNELRTKKLVATEFKGVGKTLDYIINELCNVPVIIHSEIVWGIKPTDIPLIEKYFKAVSLYRKTDLCNEVNNSNDPEVYTEKIKSWFERILREEDVEKETKHIRYVPVVEGIKNESPEGKKRKVGKIPFKDLDVTEWTSKHFCNYFEYLYKEHKGTPYLTSAADYGMMRQLLDIKEPLILKTHIENFIKSDEFKIKTIQIFRFNKTQVILDSYLDGSRQMVEKDSSVDDFYELSGGNK